MAAGTIIIELTLDGKQFRSELKSSTDAVSQGGQAMGDALKSAGDPSIFEKLKANWIAVSAAVVAAGVAMSKAKEYMTLGAAAQQAEESFRTVAAAAGESADRIVAAMKKASAGTVDDSDIMQKAIKGMTLGLSGDQLIKIMEAARISARVTGQDVTTAYEAITDAISTNMPRALKQYGLITKEQMSLVSKALAAGIEDVDLYQVAMANATLQAAKFGEVYDTAREAQQRTNAQMRELAETVGKVLLFALKEVYAIAQLAASGFMALAAANTYFLATLADVAAWTAQKLGFTETAAAMTKFGADTRKTADDLAGASAELSDKAVANITGVAQASQGASKAEIERAKQTVEAWKAGTQASIDSAAAAKKSAQEKEQAEKEVLEAIRKSALETEAIGQSQYDKDIIRINSEVEKYRKAGVDSVTIAKFREAEITAAAKKAAAEAKKLQQKSTEDFLNALEKETEEHGKAMKEEYEAEKKLVADVIKLGQKGLEESLLAQEKELEEKGKAMREEYENEKKLAIERIKLESDIYKDIRGFADEHYEAQKTLIESREAALRTAGVDEIAIAAWVNQELLKADQERAIQSDSFWDGLAAARDKYYREETKAGEVGVGIWQDFINRKKGFTGEFVDNFIAGQDLMVSVQKAAGDMLVNMAGDISKRMWNLAIDKIIDIIGAYIGEGAAATGAEGASWGGVTGALTEIATYLGVGVAAMLAGRGLAQGFKAEGGWVASHPMGGWIQEGSGTRDDVFLGVTPGVRHWGMGGEFVVNKHAAREFAPLLEGINQNYDAGGPIGKPEKWTGLADTLLMGSIMSFAHGFYKGAGPISGIAEAIAFNATAIPAMFIGKYLQNSFRERGGWLDVGHGFFDWLPPPPAPWNWGIGIPNPFQNDPMISLWQGLVNLIPGSQYFPDPLTAMQNISDPEKLKGMLLELLRAPYEQIAKDILTPAKFYSDPIDVAGNLLHNFLDIVQQMLGIQTPLFSFHDGGTVPNTGLAFLEKGERVIPRGAQDSASSELLAEVKALRADLQRGSVILANNTSDLKFLRRWDGDGIPAERTL